MTVYLPYRLNLLAWVLLQGFSLCPVFLQNEWMSLSLGPYDESAMNNPAPCENFAQGVSLKFNKNTNVTILIHWKLRM